MATVEINGHRANVAIEGDGPAVVLVHGLTGSIEGTWGPIRRDLATDHRVVAYDLRGAGASEVTPGPYSLDLLAADLVDLVGVLDLGAPMLVGHSLGGAIALAAAAEGAASRVVAAGMALELPEQARDQVGAMAEAATAQGMAAIAPGFAELGFSDAFRERRPEAADAFVDAMARADAEGFAAIAGAVAGVELASRLARVVVPALLVAGDRDALSPVAANAEIAERLPDARLEVIEDAGHEITLEQPGAMTAAIHRFEAS
jgi:3-oxoadipate enol-lactonase